MLRKGCSGGGAQEGLLRRGCSGGVAQEGVAQEGVLRRGCLGEQASRQAGRQARKKASTLSAFSRSHALEGLVEFPKRLFARVVQNWLNR